MKIFSALVCTLATCLSFPSVSRAQTPASVEAVLAPIRERTQVPGIAAAVVRDGKIIAAGVSGLRAIGRTDALELGDPLLVGSCTKRMTRMLVARLVQSGRLRFDATLSQLLPGTKMRPEYEKATLADLLEHTAGLPAYTRISPRDTPIIFELNGTPEQQRHQLVEHVLLENPAGTISQDFVYSNAGFAMIGSIVERAAGKPWETLIQEEIFQPLGIRSATIASAKDPGANTRPKGHERAPRGYELAKSAPPDDGVFASAGGVSLSIEDFARFAAADVNLDAGIGTPFLNKAAAESLATVRPARASRGDSRVFFGGQGTFTAACAEWPAKGLGIVVCVNAGKGDDVCIAAIEALRAAFASDVPAAIPLARGGSGPKLGVMLRATPDGPVIFDAVAPGSPAEAAGIKAGDELVTLNGKEMKAMEPDALSTALRAPGAKLGLRRDGKLLEIRLPDGPPAPAPK